jgi:hypothetical protein
VSDNLDIASEREELARQAAITAPRPTGPVATGRCLHCDEIVADIQRWCDVDCRDAWQRDAKHRPRA